MITLNVKIIGNVLTNVLHHEIKMESIYRTWNVNKAIEMMMC